MPRYTVEQIHEMVAANGFLVVSGAENKRAKGVFQCKHGHQWETRAGHVADGASGCPHCSGKARLSVEDAQRRLDGRGMRIVGKFKGLKKSNEFMCAHGHKWTANGRDVITAGRGCPVCSNRVPLTTEDVNKRIKHRGIVLLEEYRPIPAKLLFKGDCGHTWRTQANNVLTGKGCKKCAMAENGKRAVKEAEGKITDSLKAKGIRLVSDYQGSNVVSEFECDKGHRWSATVGNVVHKSGCLKCRMVDAEEMKERAAAKGFEVVEFESLKSDGVFRSVECGHEFVTTGALLLRKRGRKCPMCAPSGSDGNVFYIWKTNSTHKNLPVYKVGVSTDGKHVRRINRVAKASGFSVVDIFSIATENGKAFEIEKKAKELGVNPKYSGFDGATEFRAIRKKDYDLFVKALV